MRGLLAEARYVDSTSQLVTEILVRDFTVAEPDGFGVRSASLLA